MNQQTILIDKNIPIPKYLWKIKEIDVNMISFTKHITSNPMESLTDQTKTILTISDSIGTENHKVTPDVQLKMSGKVGEFVKEFESYKHNNNVKIRKIIMLYNNL